jgi:ubiquinone/menaquinone biosynthesis C-methylase UbiE
MTDAAREAPYDAVAAVYDQTIPALFEAPAKDLVALAASQPGERVLDVGTGPGTAALLAAAQVGPNGAVVAVDVSDAMLALGRRRAEAAGLAIEFRHADAQALDLPDESFDLVLSNFGLGGTDPEKSLPQLRRVLRPGGRLALSHWGPTSRPAQALMDLLARRRTETPDARLARLRAAEAACRAWETTYNTGDALAGLLAAHGFAAVRSEVKEYSYSYVSADAYLEMAAAYPVARAELDALSPGQQRMFRHEFNAAMAPFRGPNRSVISVDPILFAVGVR